LSVDWYYLDLLLGSCPRYGRLTRLYIGIQHFYSMSDKEIIIRSLEKVERRMRTNRLLRELTFGLSIFLLIPVLFKLLDLFRPFRGVTVIVVLGLWFAGLVSYCLWRMSGKGNLTHAAAELDQKAALQDEIKSAYWFATAPHGIQRSTEWVELQVRRAARKASGLNIDQLYPRVIPSTSYLAGGLLVLLIGLNVAPFSQNHNWLLGEAAPAFALTPAEQRLINQTKQLLKQAAKLDQPELVKKLEEIVQNLEEGTIDSAEALKQLEDLRNKLDEGNLDMAAINEGLDQMAQDLEGNPDTDEIAQAMSEHDIAASAEKLKQLAEELDKMDDAAKMKAIEDALKQASENSTPGMQKLAEDMKQAAENLANKNSQGVQDALNKAAKDLENLQERMQEQQAKNSASQEIQNLQESLRQRQQEQQGKEGAPQQGKGQPQKGEPGQKGEKGQPDQSAEQEASAEGEGASSEASGSGGQEGKQPGKPGDQAQSGAQGNGQNPSGAGNAPMEIMGAPTQLNVKLEQEKLTGMNDGGTPEDLEEASKQERSKLDYRNVPSQLSPAQKDVLNQDKIPWEYRNLIKNYFQAIRPQQPPRGK
jgi:hypothetical protein